VIHWRLQVLRHMVRAKMPRCWEKRIPDASRTLERRPKTVSIGPLERHDSARAIVIAAGHPFGRLSSLDRCAPCSIPQGRGRQFEAVHLIQLAGTRALIAQGASWWAPQPSAPVS
jgi:hypothetical protein